MAFALPMTSLLDSAKNRQRAQVRFKTVRCCILVCLSAEPCGFPNPTCARLGADRSRMTCGDGQRLRTRLTGLTVSARLAIETASWRLLRMVQESILVNFLNILEVFLSPFHCPGPCGQNQIGRSREGRGFRIYTSQSYSLHATFATGKHQIQLGQT
jgi:hypothetical protein